MSIEAVKIPQNVYVEDRIIGPVTLRQIIICMVGAGISYAWWSTLKAAEAVSAPATILAWSPAGVAAAFAFIKINGISLLRMCMLLIERLEKPSVRRFAPRRGIAINFKTMPSAEQLRSRQEQKSVDHISELSALLDRGPNSNNSEPDGITDEEESPLMQYATEPEAALSSSEEQVTRAPKTVNPDRIRVEPITRASTVDGMPLTNNEGASTTESSLLRDLSPPRS
jgi:hypothetical protein